MRKASREMPAELAWEAVSAFCHSTWIPFIARSLDRTAVVRIRLTEPPIGKRKQYDRQGEKMKYLKVKIRGEIVEG